MAAIHTRLFDKSLCFSSLDSTNNEQQFSVTYRKARQHPCQFFKQDSTTNSLLFNFYSRTSGQYFCPHLFKTKERKNCKRLVYSELNHIGFIFHRLSFERCLRGFGDISLQQFLLQGPAPFVYSFVVNQCVYHDSNGT